MAKIVRIQSTTTITVTPGLQHKDVTNPDAHVPDRLKVSPLWPKAMVRINAGVGDYPAEIVDWPSVKALERDKILTIGNIVEADSPEADKLEMTMANIEKEASSKRRSRRETLADIVSEG